MKISEILSNNMRTMSFEVFPPKNDSSFDSISSAIEEIASITPAFMSVTYGAGGGTSRYTLDMAKNIKNKYNIPTLAHLSCISSTKETVQARISELSDAGIENIMALRGDIPADMTADMRARLDYRYAYELVRDIRKAGDFCIGGACYPETHPESPSWQKDIEHLKIKADAGCSFLTTQMFFDNSLYYRFVDRAERAGIDIPIIAGIMPITTTAQLKRAVELSGSYIPTGLIDLSEKYQHRPDEMAKAGIDFAIRQIEDLYSRGVNAIHIYTMNKPLVARTIRDNFRMKL